MGLDDNASFFVVSPGGLFCSRYENTPSFMYENKCKIQNSFSTDVYYKIPKYYIPQLLCQMKSYNCSSLLFSCWSEALTVVFRVDFDKGLWDFITVELSSVYCGANKKRPSKFSRSVPHLQVKVNTFTEKNVHFVT